MENKEKIRIEFLRTLLDRRIGGQISCSPTEQMSEQGCSKVEGSISRVFYALNEQSEVMAVIAGSGSPTFFQVGVNLSSCPCIITEENIRFGGGDAGFITITKSAQDLVAV